jgi:hypothetical protein
MSHAVCEHDRMNLPADPGGGGPELARMAANIGGLATFAPMVLSGSLGWVRIAAPQGAARAACLAVTAYIHLMQPDVPLRKLDAEAEAAIRALEDGAASVNVIDECHRVDRCCSFLSSRPGEWPPR